MLFRKSVPKQCHDAYTRDMWANMLAGIYAGIVGPFILFIARSELDASPALLGLITAAPFVGSLLALFYANAMEGRAKMPFMVWPLTIGRFVFCFVLFTATPTPYALVVSAAQVLIMMTGPPFAVIIKQIYPDDRRATIMAYTRMALLFMTVIFTLVAGRLMPLIGYRYLIPIGALFGVAAALVFGTIKVAPTEEEKSGNGRMPTWDFLKETFSILVHDAVNRKFAIAVSIVGFGNLMLPPVFTIFQVDKLVINAGQLAWLTTASYAAWMLSYPFWGRYADMRSPVRAWMLGSLVYGMLALNYFFATKWWHVFPGTIIAGIASAGMDLGYFNVILYLSRKGKETQHQALHSFTQGIRGVAGPFLGAAAITLAKNAHVPVKYIFLVSVALIVLGVLAMMGGKGRDT